MVEAVTAVRENRLFRESRGGGRESVLTVFWILELDGHGTVWNIHRLCWSQQEEQRENHLIRLHCRSHYVAEQRAEQEIPEDFHAKHRIILYV